MNNINIVDIKSAFVETTSLCNLKCKHCYNDSGVSCNYIDFKVIEGLVSSLVELNAEFVSISGGEPLLHPDFDRIMGLLDHYNIKFQIITNGTLLHKKIGVLEKYKRSIFIQISLDGVGTTHDKLRGYGTFDLIAKNIKMLKEKGFTYFFKTTIHKKNYPVLEEIVVQAIDFGGSSISFSFINPVGRGLLNRDLHMDQGEIYKVFKALQLLKDKYNDKIKIGVPTLYRNSICPWFAYSSGSKLKISPRIDVKGNVYLCSAFMSEKFSIGNINKHSLKDILLVNEDIYELLSFLSLYSKYIDCQRCLLNSNCNKGCPASVLEKLTEYDDNFCGSRRFAAVDYICQAEGIHTNRGLK